MDTANAARRILILDDDPALIELVADGLRMVGGYEVIVAANGADGLVRFFETRPDCVVVDVRMPGLNGYQFIRALRGDAATSQTPIVVLSALAQDRDELAGRLSGADIYLCKPVKIPVLLAAIERVMQVSPEDRVQDVLRLAGAADSERGEA